MWALSPVASWPPSPRQADDCTSPACPSRSLTAGPVARSQILTDLPAAAANCLPSGLTARACKRGRMTGEGLGGAGRREIPDLRGIILAAREDVLAVGRDRDGQDELGVPLEFLDLLAGGGVPEADGVIETRGRQGLAVGAPGDRSKPGRMPVEGADDRGLLRQREPRRHQWPSEATRPRG